MQTRKRKAISLRIAEPTLSWFKEKQPKGYQTLINSVLEEYVQQQAERMQWTAGRAQEIFKKYYAQCFWHYSPDLRVNPANIQIVIEGLKKYGGREGFLLAKELCQ